MKQLLRIEVEPLSDQRWERIERSLTARLEREARQAISAPEQRRRAFEFRSWLVAVAVMGALAAAVIAIRPWSERAMLEHPSRITTGHSPSHLALPGLSLDVEPDSAVVVSAETPQGLLIVLDRGGIVCQVAPRSKEAPLIVQAGEARVLVLGTRFSVTRLGETARVQVHEGVVEVTSRGQSREVRAGEEWPSQSAQQWTKDLGQGPENDSDVEAPTAPTPAAPDRKKPVVAGKLQAKAVAAGGSPPSSSSATGPRQPVGAATPSAAVAARSTSPPSSQAMFEEATALERSEPARAARLYRRLETGHDSWAQNALYARGRLEASRGNPGEARRLLESYLERFPRGSNAEDARAVLRRLR